MRKLNAEGRFRLWVFSGIAAFLLGVLAATVVHNLAVPDDAGRDYRPEAVEEEKENLSVAAERFVQRNVKL